MHIILICLPRGPCEYFTNVNDIIEVPKSSLLYTPKFSRYYLFSFFFARVGRGPFYYYYIRANVTVFSALRTNNKTFSSIRSMYQRLI